jgi:hypothetical protein
MFPVQCKSNRKDNEFEHHFLKIVVDTWFEPYEKSEDNFSANKLKNSQVA